MVLRADHPGQYRPEKINPALPTDTGYGDVAAGLASAAVRVAATYTTPVQHNNPMEPHAAIALPFTNMSGDLEQEYFSDGISEDIITDL